MKKMKLEYQWRQYWLGSIKFCLRINSTAIIRLKLDLEDEAQLRFVLRSFQHQSMICSKDGRPSVRMITVTIIISLIIIIIILFKSSLKLQSSSLSWKRSFWILGMMDAAGSNISYSNPTSKSYQRVAQFVNLFVRIWPMVSTLKT